MNSDYAQVAHVHLAQRREEFSLTVLLHE